MAWGAVISFWKLGGGGGGGLLRRRWKEEEGMGRKRLRRWRPKNLCRRQGAISHPCAKDRPEFLGHGRGRLLLCRLQRRVWGEGCYGGGGGSRRRRMKQPGRCECGVEGDGRIREDSDEGVIGLS